MSRLFPCDRRRDLAVRIFVGSAIRAGVEDVGGERTKTKKLLSDQAFTLLGIFGEHATRCSQLDRSIADLAEL
jgi:hypothetical protein